MKFFVTNPNNDFAETPVQEEGRIIHHLHLAKGKEVPEHSADALVTVVCLSGNVSFFCRRTNRTASDRFLFNDGAQ